jgi:hypothetical protein
VVSVQNLPARGMELPLAPTGENHGTQVRPRGVLSLRPDRSTTQTRPHSPIEISRHIPSVHHSLGNFRPTIHYITKALDHRLCPAVCIQQQNTITHACLQEQAHLRRAVLAVRSVKVIDSKLYNAGALDKTKRRSCRRADHRIHWSSTPIV